MRIGVVGAGVWSERVHLPALLAHPGSRVSGVWSRRHEQARATAQRFDVDAVDDLDQLIAASDAIDLAVPPAVQPELALRAARAGRHVILEKPAGIDTALLEQLRDVVLAQGLAARVFMNRFFDPSRAALLSRLAGGDWIRGRSEWRSGSLLPDSPFANGWRDADNVLYDIGPHTVSQLEAIFGEVQEGRIVTRTDTRIELLLRHASGAESEMAIDVGVPVPVLQEDITLWSSTGPERPALAPVEAVPAFGRLLDWLAADIRTGKRSGAGAIDRTGPTGLEDAIRLVALLNALSATGVTADRR